MSSEEFRQLREMFERLRDLPPAEHRAVLDNLEGVSAEMASQLRRMLAASVEESTFLDNGALALPRPESSASDPLESVGSRIGPYQVTRVLGRGGMGIVYEAVRADGSFDRRVAIKVLRGGAMDGFLLKRFDQERRILGQLDHPHIAAIIDAGMTGNGDPYFVMDYVDGEPVTAYCEKHHLSIRQKLELFLQICAATQYAHRNLTVHRDLKPGNILVTQAGAVKLLDFGIAKLLGPDGEADPAATAAILTPEYASPEQIRREAIATAADIFTLGILLYELISGHHPFRGEGRLPHEVMRAICEEDPPPPSSVAQVDGRQIRGELDAIVMTALRKEPAWRYQSVEQLADDVDRYRRGWPVMARGNTLPYRARKFVRRQWLPLAATAALIAALGAGVLVATHQAGLASAARLQAEAARAQAERERAVADQARILAEQQRRAAEAAQKSASEQQGVAEARRVEADNERQKEHRRYREVRSLASSLLFDVYDSVRDLAGSATARRLMVRKAQHQLEILQADSGNDPDLRRDLAASYERLGELRADPRRPDKSDAAVAVSDYERGVALRRNIAARAGSGAADRRDLALSLAKLGDGEFTAGNTREALAAYEESRNIARQLAGSGEDSQEGTRALGIADERLCAARLAGGNTRQAIDSCREGLAALKPLAEAAPDDLKIQNVIAVTEASYANALRLTGKPRDAVPEAQVALVALRRLQTLAPSNAEYRRLFSSGEMILALCLSSGGDMDASLDAFNGAVHAMEIAIEIDPSDLNSSLRLASALLAFSRRLEASGQKERAHGAAREALRLLQSTAAKPAAGAVEWNEYADALLKAAWPDLRDPAKALQLATNAVATTKKSNPFFLDTLAWAYFRNGKPAEAVETEKAALSLLPSGATGGLHDELVRGLNTFQGGGPK